MQTPPSSTPWWPTLGGVQMYRMAPCLGLEKHMVVGRPVGVFHALAISRGNSLLKSRWIQDFLEFYGRNLFKAESSATCGVFQLPRRSRPTGALHVRLGLPYILPDWAIWCHRGAGFAAGPYGDHQGGAGEGCQGIWGSAHVLCHQRHIDGQQDCLPGPNGPRRHCPD